MQSEQGATGPFCQHRWKAAGLLGLSIVSSLQKGREKYQKNAGEEEMGEVMAKLPEEECAGTAEDAVGPYGHV